MTGQRWQVPVNLVLGLWLFVSPWALDHAMHQNAAWNAHMMGAGIVVFAAMAAYMPKAWEEMLNTVLGALVHVKPGKHRPVHF